MSGSKFSFDSKCIMTFLVVILLSMAILSAGFPNSQLPSEEEQTTPYTREKFTPEASPSTILSDLEMLNLEALVAHNEYRTRHGVSPLRISFEICENITQPWANAIATRQGLYHSENLKYGENLYWTSIEQVDGETPVDSWYSEIEDFDWNNISWQDNAGHFTQIIWKTTTEFCMAKAVANDGSTYIVANYRPPGNIFNDFSENVSPPLLPELLSSSPVPASTELPRAADNFLTATPDNSRAGTNFHQIIE